MTRLAKTTAPLLLAALSFAVAQPSGGAAASQTGETELAANAQLVDPQGNAVGDVNLTAPAGEGEPFVTIQVGLDPEAGIEPGEYGFHIHQVGQCTPTFDAAGDHFNPTGAQHGLLNQAGPHAGDLPNLVVGEDGATTYVVNTNLVTLGEGERSLFDDDGSAMMLHAQADDYLTAPSGTSGDRIACGVIEQR